MGNSGKLFSILFDISPTLFIETGRIEAKTTECILLQQFFKEPSIYGRELLSRKIKNISRKAVKNVEDNVKKKIVTDSVYKSLKRAGFEVLPSVMILNRISKPYLVNEIFFYLCYEDKVRDVSRKLSLIKKIELDELKMLKNNSAESIINSIVKINRLEGELLSYPDCCISGFVKDKKDGIFHETKITLECLQNEEFEVAIDCFLSPEKVRTTELPDFFYSHFTSNFYPCSILCKKAIKIGKTNEEYFDEFKELYRGKLILNVLYHLATAYVSYEIVVGRGLEIDTEYRRFISDYFKKMDSEIVSILARVKDLLIYSPNELCDIYLKKILA